MIREVVGGHRASAACLGECDGVLSGYMGGADIGAAILDAVATVKRANPAARYCCDPVIGDVGRGVFVRDGIPEFMTRPRRCRRPISSRPTSSSWIICPGATAKP